MTGAVAREGRFSRLIMPFELRSGELFRNFMHKRHFLKNDFPLCVMQALELSGMCNVVEAFDVRENESSAVWFDFIKVWWP